MHRHNLLLEIIKGALTHMRAEAMYKTIPEAYSKKLENNNCSKSESDACVTKAKDRLAKVVCTLFPCKNGLTFSQEATCADSMPSP